MTIVHIVLAKIKPDLSSSAIDTFKEKTHALAHEKELVPFLQEMRWGPPAYDGRTKGYNWGLYSTFADRSQYEQYRDHPVHRSFVENVIKPNTEDLMAYDFEI